MKTPLKTIFLYLLIVVASTTTSCMIGIGQAPPSSVIEVIPVSPHPSYIWTPGYYRYSNRAYVWNAGRYVQPRRRATVWQPHYYNQNKRGVYKLKKGRWK